MTSIVDKHGKPIEEGDMVEIDGFGRYRAMEIELFDPEPNDQQSGWIKLYDVEGPWDDLPVFRRAGLDVCDEVEGQGAPTIDYDGTEAR